MKAGFEAGLIFLFLISKYYKMNDYCGVITCMDGRIQRPVLDWIEKTYGYVWADLITEAGPVRAFYENDAKVLAGIFERALVSINAHGSKEFFIVAHDDCAGNPGDKQTQLLHLRKSIMLFKERFPEIKVYGLWVDADFSVERVY